MTARPVSLLLLGVVLVTWSAPPALAAEDDPATGYWARTRTGLPVPLEPPDPVPEGGTWVASEPTGPLAVSALRAALPAGVIGLELRLPVADALGAPAVQVCPSTDRWAPEQGGRLEGAPQADCSAPLDARLDADVLVVPLPPGRDEVNVLLRPAPGSAFSLTMERATAAAVVTAPAPSTAAPPVPPADEGSPTSVAAPPAFEPGFVMPPDPPAAVDPGPLLAAPAVPPAAADPLQVAAPVAAPAPVALPVAARPAAPPDDRATALLALAVLALLAAQAVRLARRPATAPRALGGSARRSGAPTTVATAAPDTRGVGRFRTARARPPVRL